MSPPAIQAIPAPTRGSVWLARLAPTEGHEQAGTRPVVVISADELSRLSSGMVIVLPLTTKFRGFPSRVPAHFKSQQSFVICEQPRAISTRRLQKRLGSLKADVMASVDEKLLWILGLA